MYFFSMGFEEIYKTSYSHGLESIYAIETVDLRSVRRLSSPVEKAQPVHKRIVAPASITQLQFDFGPGFNDWMEPFILEEPIQVLGLSRHAEKSLLDQRKLLLRDLAGKDLRRIIPGVGQGHLDEISQKLGDYLSHKEAQRSYQFDPGSWLRSLCPFEQRKQCHLLLESYGLQELLPLTPAEVTEVRRLPPDQKKKWHAEGLSFLKSPACRTSILKALHNMASAFLKPWIQGRKGLATENEVVERLEKRFIEPRLVEPFLRLLSQALGNTAFAACLWLADQQVYTAERWQAEAFRKICGCAATYFKSSGQKFLFSHLLSLVERELARDWLGYPEGFIAKSLRLSASFSIRKDETGCLAMTARKNQDELPTRLQVVANEK